MLVMRGSINISIWNSLDHPNPPPKIRRKLGFLKLHFKGTLGTPLEHQKRLAFCVELIHIEFSVLNFFELGNWDRPSRQQFVHRR